MSLQRPEVGQTPVGGRMAKTETRKTQMTFLGHVVRVDSLENLAITSRIAGSRSRGRPRVKYLDRMKDYIGREVPAQQVLVMMRNREQRFP